MSVTVRLKAGLGNRLFQLSAAAFYANAHGLDLVIYDDLVDGPVHDTSSNEYLWTIAKLRHVQGQPKPEDSAVLCGLYEDLVRHRPTKPVMILDGYFQDPRFADSLRPYVNTYLESTVRRYGKRPTTFVHVRLGDYERQSGNLFYTQIESYYNKALSQTDGLVEIYSNRPEEAEHFLKGLPAYDNLSAGSQLVFGRHGSVQDTMESMFTCEKAIIANSTYSWWAAQFLVWTSSFASHAASVLVPEPWARLTMVPSLLYRLTKIVEPVKSMSVPGDSRWTLVPYNAVNLTPNESILTSVVAIGLSMAMWALLSKAAKQQHSY